jgi:acetyl esterase/lipase
MHDQNQSVRGRAFGPAPVRARGAANLALWLALAVAALGGCGSTADSQTTTGPELTRLGPASPIPGLKQRMVGKGTETTALLWSRGSPPPHQAVIFLHGWLPTPPRSYGLWLRHLAERGNTIVYPVYQEWATKLKDFLAGAIAGTRLGLRAAHADPASVVVIGHTIGGALAFDYAATAPHEGLPAPRAVLAVYPGRKPPGKYLPPADLSGIAPGTLLETIAGPGDPIPKGDAQARSLLAGATAVPQSRRRYLEVKAPPSLFPPRSAWTAADRLIAEARAASASP